jgi:hypothetical protein
VSELRYQMGYARHLHEGVEEMLSATAPTIVSAALVTRRLMAQGWRIVRITKINLIALDDIEFDAFAVLVSRREKNGS